MNSGWPEHSLSYNSQVATLTLPLALWHYGNANSASPVTNTSCRDHSVDQLIRSSFLKADRLSLPCNISRPGHERWITGASCGRKWLIKEVSPVFLHASCSFSLLQSFLCIQLHFFSRSVNSTEADAMSLKTLACSSSGKEIPHPAFSAVFR